MAKTSLSKSTAWYGLGNLFIRSVSFLLLPLYSNMLSTAEFGNYALVMSFYALVSVLYQAGLQNSLTKYYLDEKDEDKRALIFSTIFNTVFLIGFILTAAAFVFSGYFSKLILNTPDFSNLIILISAALFAETLSYFGLHLLKTKELSKKVVTISALGAVLNLILNILFVYLMNRGVAGILEAQLITSVFTLALVIPSFKPEYVLKIRKEYIPAFFKFSWPFIAAGALSAAVDVSDRFILNHFLGKEDVGIYSFSYRIAMIMNVFVISFRTAWVPHSINLVNAGKYKETLGKTFNKLVAVSGFILLTVSLFAGILFSIKIGSFTIFNSGYESGLTILPYVLLGYMFSGIGAFYFIYPFIAEKSYLFLISDAIAFAVNIILNFILVPVYGMKGSAVATTEAFAAGALYLYAVSIRKVEIKYELSRLLIITLSIAAFLLAGLTFNNLLISTVILIGYLLIVHFAGGIDLKKTVRLTD